MVSDGYYFQHYSGRITAPVRRQLVPARRTSTLSCSPLRSYHGTISRWKAAWSGVDGGLGVIAICMGKGE